MTSELMEQVLTSGTAASEDIVSSASGAQTAGFTLHTATDWYMVVATFRST